MHFADQKTAWYVFGMLILDGFVPITPLKESSVTCVMGIAQKVADRKQNPSWYIFASPKSAALEQHWYQTYSIGISLQILNAAS